MKKLVWIILIVFTLSCSKDDDDILVNTIWQSGEIELSFASNEQVVCKVNNVLSWVGVYILYDNNSILIYKAVAGKELMDLTYTGIVDENEMRLSDEENNLLIFKNKTK